MYLILLNLAKKRKGGRRGLPEELGDEG